MTSPSDHDQDIDSSSPADADNSQLYTPAMLAELLEVSVRTIRRWQRAGFLTPVREVMQLPHFDFAALTQGKQLAGWMRQGATVPSIQHQVEAIQRRLGEVVPIEDLPITAEGGRLLLREGDRFVEATGQFCFDFAPDELDVSDSPATLKMSLSAIHEAPNELLGEDELEMEEMIEAAIAAEDLGDFDTAVRWCRCALSAFGPNAEISFQIAELLYRSGDVSGARERYFMAVELDPDLVEARANLGCVLAEGGQLDLAIAAFEGALEQFPEYADVHFHLARALDDHEESGRAAIHWQRFLDLAPASPWADEAQARLNEHVPLKF